jgi:hypothetical protein
VLSLFLCEVGCLVVGLVGLHPQTLEFVYVLNAGTVHEGTPFSHFSIFAPPTCFFWHFFYKIEIYDPNLA